MHFNSLYAAPFGDVRRETLAAEIVALLRRLFASCTCSGESNQTAIASSEHDEWKSHRATKLKGGPESNRCSDQGQDSEKNDGDINYEERGAVISGINSARGRR